MVYSFGRKISLLQYVSLLVSKLAAPAVGLVTAAAALAVHQTIEPKRGPLGERAQFHA